MGVRTTAAKVPMPVSGGQPPVAAIARRRGGRTVETASISPFVKPAREAAYTEPTDSAVRRLNALLDDQSSRIAGVLHDEASQVLASAHMAIEEVAGDAAGPAQARLRQVRQHLHEVAEQLRRISHELRPSIVDDLGAIDAIRFIARTFTRRTGIPVALNMRAEAPGATAGTTAYRFVLAALTNIGEHAHATSASIAIARDGSRLVCTVCDDGVGFDAAAAMADTASRGLSLRLVRARLEALGGTLDITSARHQGARLHAVIPLER